MGDNEAMKDYSSQEVDLGKKIEVESNAPDLLGLIFSASDDPSEFKGMSFDQAYDLTENQGVDFSLRNREDYWKIDNIKEKFEGKEDFDNFYDKLHLINSVRETVDHDVLGAKAFISDTDGDYLESVFREKYLGEINIANLVEGSFASMDSSTLFGERVRTKTNKQVALAMGELKDGKFEDAPGTFEQMMTSDLWRVARDEEGMPKLTVDGNPFIQRVDGGETIHSTDDIVTIFNSGALAKNFGFLDGNKVDQGFFSVAARQIPKVIPYTAIATFISSAISGTAELGKSIGSAMGADKDSSFMRSMNMTQNYLKRYSFEMDERSRQSMWNLNNMTNSIGDIVPQLLGMQAVTKIVPSILGLRSSKLAGELGRKRFTKAFESYYADKTVSAAQKKMVSSISSFMGRGSMSMMATEDFAREAKESGLSDRDALIMHASFSALMYGFASKLTENIIKPYPETFDQQIKANLFKSHIKRLTGQGVKNITPEKAAKEGGLMATTFNSMREKVSDIYQSAGSTGVKAYLGAMMSEGLEETVETAEEYGLKWMYNATLGKGKEVGDGRFAEHDFSEFAKEAIFAGAMGSVGGGIGKSLLNQNMGKKVTRITSDNYIKTMVKASNTAEERNIIDVMIAKKPKGAFGSEKLSYARDERGKYRPVDSSSTDEVLRVSQADSNEYAFKTLWENIKLHSDEQMKRAVEDLPEFKDKSPKEIKEAMAEIWSGKTQEAFGDQLTVQMTDALDDMANHISYIVKEDANVEELQRQVDDKSTPEGTKKELKEKIKTIKDKMEAASEKVRDIVQGKSANEYYEKALFELFQDANKHSDGRISKKGDADYISYSVWKAMRKEMMEEVKFFQEEDVKESSIRKISANYVDELENMTPEERQLRILNDKLPDLREEDKKRILESLKNAPVSEEIKQAFLAGMQEIKTNIEITQNIEPGSEGQRILDDAFARVIRDLKKPGRKLADLRTISLNYALPQGPDGIYDPNSDEFVEASEFLKSSDVEGLQEAIDATDKAITKVADFAHYNFKFNEISEASRQRHDEALQITDSDELIEFIKKVEEEKGNILYSTELAKHLNDTVDAPKKESLIKSVGSDRMSAMNTVIQLISWDHDLDPSQRAMKAYLDYDRKGGKYIHSQIKEEVIALNTAGPESYDGDMENLERIRKVMSDRKEFIRSILSIEPQLHKFQAVNKDKFEFKNKIETIISDDATDSLYKMYDPSTSEEEAKTLESKVNESLTYVAKAFSAHSNDTLLDGHVLDFLINTLYRNKGESIRGVYLNDMAKMESTGDMLEELITTFIFPASDISETKTALLDALTKFRDIDGTNQDNVTEKWAAIKEVELMLHIYLMTLSEEDKMKINLGKFESRMLSENTRVLYAYYLMMSRESFATVQQSFEQDVARLTFTSSPTYEQSRAVIQMAVKLTSPLEPSVEYLGTKGKYTLNWLSRFDQAQHFGDTAGLSDKEIKENSAQNFIPELGYVRGIGGAGKTTYIAAVVKMMKGSGDVVLLAPGKSQAETLVKGLKDTGIVPKETPTNDDGDLDIETLIGLLNGSDESIVNSDLIIIDEITRFPASEVSRLADAVREFNKNNEGSDIRILGLGDPLQASSITMKGNNYNTIMTNGIDKLSGIEMTPIIRSSQRTGYLSNTQLFETIREAIETTKNMAEEQKDVTLTYEVKKVDGISQDIGVQIATDADDWNAMVKGRIKRALAVDHADEKKNKNRIVIVTTVTKEEDAEAYAALEEFGIPVMSVHDAQSQEFDQVIVDIPHLNTMQHVERNNIMTQLFYTAVSRAQKGILIKKATGWKIVTIPGIVPNVEAKLNSKVFDTYKKKGVEIRKVLSDLEKSLTGKELATGGDIKVTIKPDMLTKYKELYTIVMDAYSKWEGDDHTKFRGMMDQEVDLLLKKLDGLVRASDISDAIDAAFKNSLFLSTLFDKDAFVEAMKLNDAIRTEKEILNDAIKELEDASKFSGEAVDRTRESLLDILYLMDSSPMDSYVYYELSVKLLEALDRSSQDTNLSSYLTPALESVRALIEKAGYKMTSFDSSVTFDKDTMAIDGDPVIDPSLKAGEVIIEEVVSQAFIKTANGEVVSIPSLGADHFKAKVKVRRAPGKPIIEGDYLHVLNLLTEEDRSEIITKHGKKSGGIIRNEIERAMRNGNNEDAYRKWNQLQADKELRKSDLSDLEKAKIEFATRSGVDSIYFMHTKGLDNLANSAMVKMENMDPLTDLEKIFLTMYYNVIAEDANKTHLDLLLKLVEGVDEKSKNLINSLLGMTHQNNIDVFATESLITLANNISEIDFSKVKFEAEIKAHLAQLLEKFKNAGFAFIQGTKEIEADYAKSPKNYSVEKIPGTDTKEVIESMKSPIYDASGNLVKPGYVRIALPKKKDQSGGGGDTKPQGKITRTFKNDDKSARKTKLLTAASNGEILNYLWLNVDLTPNSTRKLTLADFHRLKMEATNALQESEVSFRLKKGFVAENLENEVGAAIFSKDAIEDVNNGREILYIEATVPDSVTGEYFTIVYSVMPLDGNILNMDTNYPDLNIAELYDRINGLKGSIPTEGLDITSAMKNGTSKRIVKGRFTNTGIKLGVTLSEFMRSHSPNGTKTPLTFSDDVYVLTSNIVGEDGNTVAKKGQAYLVASPNKAKTILNETIKDLVQGDWTKVSDDVLLVPVREKARSLDEIIEDYHKLTDPKYASFLASASQLNRFLRAGNNMIAELRSKEGKETKVEKMFFQIKNHKLSNGKKLFSKPKEGEWYNVDPAAFIEFLETLRSEDKQTFDEMWQWFKKIPKKGFDNEYKIKPDVKDANGTVIKKGEKYVHNLNYNRGFFGNFPMNTGSKITHEKKASIDVSTVKGLEGSGLSLDDVAVIPYDTVTAPSVVFTDSGIQRIVDSASEQITKSEKSKLMKAQKAVIMDLHTLATSSNLDMSQDSGLLNRLLGYRDQLRIGRDKVDNHVTEMDLSMERSTVLNYADAQLNRIDEEIMKEEVRLKQLAGQGKKLGTFEDLQKELKSLSKTLLSDDAMVQFFNSPKVGLSLEWILNNYAMKILGLDNAGNPAIMDAVNEQRFETAFNNLYAYNLDYALRLEKYENIILNYKKVNNICKI